MSRVEKLLKLYSKCVNAGIDPNIFPTRDYTDIALIATKKKSEYDWMSPHERRNQISFDLINLAFSAGWAAGWSQARAVPHRFYFESSNGKEFSVIAVDLYDAEEMAYSIAFSDMEDLTDDCSVTLIREEGTGVFF